MAPNFSLQSVLDYRHSRVELLEVELGSLVQAEQRGQLFLDTLQHSRSRLYGQLNECQQGDIDLYLLARLRSSLESVNTRIQKQETSIQELHEQINAKQVEVVEARQEEQALVTLKNKEIERYTEEQKQQESRLQDDIYIAQAYRRSISLA